MKKSFALALLFAAIPVIAVARPARCAPPGGRIEVCFSPNLPGGCDPTRAILAAISGARKTIHLQMYALTSREIAGALASAKRRGVDVRVIVDRGQLYHDRSEPHAVNLLVAAGIPILVDAMPGLMHDKVMIVDQETVLTGSFNYTWSAEHENAENLLVIDDPGLAAEYLRNWNGCAARSRPLRTVRPSHYPSHRWY